MVEVGEGSGFLAERMLVLKDPEVVTYLEASAIIEGPVLQTISGQYLQNTGTRTSSAS